MKSGYMANSDQSEAKPVIIYKFFATRKNRIFRQCCILLLYYIIKSTQAIPDMSSYNICMYAHNIFHLAI